MPVIGEDTKVVNGVINYYISVREFRVLALTTDRIFANSAHQKGQCTLRFALPSYKGCKCTTPPPDFDSDAMTASVNLQSTSYGLHKLPYYRKTVLSPSEEDISLYLSIPSVLSWYIRNPYARPCHPPLSIVCSAATESSQIET